MMGRRFGTRFWSFSGPRFGAGIVIRLAIGLSSGGVLAQDDGFTFEVAAPEITDSSQARFDAARAFLDREEYAEALAAFDALLADKTAAKHHDAAQYDAAKALYRMGLYHSALARFSDILEVGPEHAFYKKSREWLFFIARQSADQEAALSLIATYAKKEDVPPEFADEFNFQLAKYYFLGALHSGAKGVVVEQSEEESGDTDSMDFGDGLDLGEKAATPADTSPKGGQTPAKKGHKKGPQKKDHKKGKKGKKSKSSDEDMDFSEEDFDFGAGDDDGFDFSFDGVDDTPAPKKKKRSKKKHRRRGRKKNGSDKGGQGDANVRSSSNTAKSASPKRLKTAKKEHKNENPKDAEAALKLALEHVNLVSDKFERSSKALYLKGLIHFAVGDFEKSVQAFRGVVRLTKEGETQANPKLREMAFFSLARIHYQFEQFRYSIFYYERIDRDSEAWLDALFESSWAHFRLGEYEKALGNLITIQSPFFADEYYPESHILKAITYYENCRYPEANAFLSHFKLRYDGVIAELERLVGEKPSPEDLYAELTALESQVAKGVDDQSNSGAMTARLVRLALSDKRLVGFRRAIAEVEDESEALMAIAPPFAGTPAQTELSEALQKRRSALVAQAGGLMSEKLSGELNNLRGLASKLIRIQFEIAKQEKQALEASLRNESQTVPISNYSFSTATDDERQYWPFEGEYWRDELGTYEYTLTRGCRPKDEG